MKYFDIEKNRISMGMLASSETAICEPSSLLMSPVNFMM